MIRAEQDLPETEAGERGEGGRVGMGDRVEK
jgi:hypothetical protein